MLALTQQQSSDPAADRDIGATYVKTEPADSDVTDVDTDDEEENLAMTPLNLVSTSLAE